MMKLKETECGIDHMKAARHLYEVDNPTRAQVELLERDLDSARKYEFIKPSIWQRCLPQMPDLELEEYEAFLAIGINTWERRLLQLRLDNESLCEFALNLIAKCQPDDGSFSSYETTLISRIAPELIRRLHDSTA